MTKNYITATELAAAVGMSEAYAYAVIKKLNTDLKNQGYQTISGRLPIKYAAEKFYGIDFGEVANGE